MQAAILTTALSLFVNWPDSPGAGSWPQFRGPGGNGVAVGSGSLPTEIGPDQYVVWKTAIPSGHSSPVLYGDRIYLTGIEGKRQYTFALDHSTGKEIWRAEAPARVAEKIHGIGSHAQSTPVTDGRHVVSLFGSAGLYCYDRDGKELWNVPMGPLKTEFGAATSPLLVDGRVILAQDYDGDSFLIVLNVENGKPIWRADRAEFPVGYASPAIWTVDGKKQIVQAGALRVVGYDFDTGKEIWTVRGMARVCNMTPSIGPDNVLYLAGWAAGADAGDLIVIPPFEEVLAKHDKNKNGVIEFEELPAGPVKERFPQYDPNRDRRLDRAEWDRMRAIFALAKNRMVAIRPGGTGDITTTHVLWQQTKQLPYVPSPLLYQGLLFMVKNGGLVSTLDPKTGKSLKYDRIGAAGNYYSSPVGGDGKVYFASQNGDLTVISALAQWQVLHSVHFGEEIFATPAIVDGRIYLRTAGHLYCFANK